MKLFKKATLGLMAICSMALVANCGGSDDPQPPVPNENLPSITASVSTLVTGVDAEGETAILSVDVKTPEGFKSLSIRSDKGFEEDITEAENEEGFAYSVEVNTEGMGEGLEIFTFEVTDQNDKTSQVEITLYVRLPAVYFPQLTLSNQFNGDNENAFLDLNTGDIFSKSDIDNNVDLEESIELFYRKDDATHRLIPTGSVFTESLYGAPIGSNLVTFKKLPANTLSDYDSESDFDSRLAQIEALDSLYAETASEELNQANLSVGSEFVFQTSSGYTGIIHSVLVNDNEAILKIVINGSPILIQ